MPGISKYVLIGKKFLKENKAVINLDNDTLTLTNEPGHHVTVNMVKGIETLQWDPVEEESDYEEETSTQDQLTQKTANKVNHPPNDTEEGSASIKSASRNNGTPPEKAADENTIDAKQGDESSMETGAAANDSPPPSISGNQDGQEVRERVSDNPGSRNPRDLGSTA